MTQNPRILGIESSCDETAAAVVDASGVLSSVVWGQDGLHDAYGGVVPEIAARAHAERLDICIDQAMQDAGQNFDDLHAIAVTSGPGLIGGVVSGVMCAKGLAAVTGLPLIGVNHLAGHALTPRMTDGLRYPYLMLLVSGGHCQYLAVLGHDQFRRMGGTIDDAPGEAFDKVARMLGLGYPGGPAVEAQALGGNPRRFNLPRPLMDRPGCDVSFSGLKTAVRRTIDVLVLDQGGISEQDRADLCAGFQAAVADVLAEKTRRAVIAFHKDHAPDTPTIAVAGGVAANATLRASLTDVAQSAGFAFVAPPLKYCTDNAAMIAWAGMELFNAGHRDDMTLAARPRWPLDVDATPMLGSGKKGARA